MQNISLFIDLITS